MDEQRQALEASAARLRRITEALDAEQLVSPSYDSEWSIADVLSHIGSGAVIMRRSIEAADHATTVPEGFNQSVWDEWNAKSPAAQATDVLVADAALLRTVSAISEEQAATLQFTLGPMTLDLPGFLVMRLSEHALHTWDVEAISDATATVPSEAAGLIAHNLGMIAGFSAEPDGEASEIRIETTEPALNFRLTTTADSVSLTEVASDDTAADLCMPTEALVRLVYGRLDAEHTEFETAAAAQDLLGRLRTIFPGF